MFLERAACVVLISTIILTFFWPVTGQQQQDGGHRYSSEFLLSLQSSHCQIDTTDFPIEILTHLPDYQQNSTHQKKQRKRGKRGGAQRRLRKYGLSDRRRIPPLPSVLLANMQSLRNKTDELEAYVKCMKEYRETCLLAFTETWLGVRDADEDLAITGFGRPIRLDRSSAITGKSTGGGVCFYINEQYLDFAKAFDAVPHERLLLKLGALGIGGAVLAWIRGFLSDRRQRVSVNGALSDWAAVTSGVPQGSVLGPVLFVAFINDLPDALESLCAMYADDTKVYTGVDDSTKQQQLQSDLDKLSDWSDKWQLRFNADKCKVLHLGKGNSQFDYNMRKHGSTERVALQKSDLERDLGVNVDSNLKFSRHIEIQVNKANRLLGLIRRSFEYLDTDTMKRLFIAIVRPHLEFANVVWAPSLVRDKKLVESVLRRATRVIPGLKDLTYEERLEKMKIPSMAYRRMRGDMIEVYKYTHEVYNLRSDMFTVDEKSNTRGHEYKLEKHRCNTTLRQLFFSQRVVERWNKLPPTVVSAPSLNSFKNRLDAVYNQYKYSVEEPPTVCLIKRSVVC